MDSNVERIIKEVKDHGYGDPIVKSYYRIFVDLFKFFYKTKSEILLHTQIFSIDELKEAFKLELARIKNIKVTDTDKDKLKIYLENNTKASQSFLKFYKKNLETMLIIADEMKGVIEELDESDFDYMKLDGRTWDNYSREEEFKNNLEKFEKLEKARKTRKKVKGATLLVDYFITNPTFEQLQTIQILTSTGKKIRLYGYYHNLDNAKPLIENKEYHNLKYYYDEGPKVGQEYHGKVENLRVSFV